MKTSNKLGNYLKEEKDYENQDYRRKVKNAHRDRVVMARPLTVWERLSKVKKSPSIINFAEAGRTRQALSRLGPLVTESHAWHSEAHEQSPRKAPVRPILPETRNIRRTTVQRTVILPPGRQESPTAISGVARKQIKELLTARNISNTSSIDMERTSTTLQTTNSVKVAGTKNAMIKTKIDSDRTSVFDLYSESKDSLDSNEYVTAPLIPVPTRTSLHKTSRILSNLCNTLEKEKRAMPVEDVQVLKNVVKSDERHRQLRADDSTLFKDILKSKLKQIMHQESVVKNALFSLNCKNADGEQKEQSMMLNGENGLPQQHVDIIFKNVPTIQKEVIILKALGERLEATLRRTTTNMDSETDVSKETMWSGFRTARQDLEPIKESLPTVESVHSCAWIEDVQKNAQVQVRPMGIKHDIGLVHEFEIKTTTLSELKRNANTKFYMRDEDEQNMLKRTCYNRLAKKPDVLMRYLKSDGAMVPFNLLDHDAIFFNSFILPDKSSKSSDSSDSSDNSSESRIMLCEGGDSTQGKKFKRVHQQMEPLEIEEIKTTPKKKRTNKKTQTNAIQRKQVPERKIKKLGKGTQSKPIRRTVNGKAYNMHARRERREVTPMPLDKSQIEPKNNLIRTMIIGSAQVSVFLLLIMAFTYPDVTC